MHIIIDRRSFKAIIMVSHDPEKLCNRSMRWMGHQGVELVGLAGPI
jgi:hypothetical protein